MLLGVTWLHRAGKLIDKDIDIMKELDYIASVFRYYRNDEGKINWHHVMESVQGKKQKVRSLVSRNTEMDSVIVQFVKFGMDHFGQIGVHVAIQN